MDVSAEWISDLEVPRTSVGNVHRAGFQENDPQEWEVTRHFHFPFVCSWPLALLFKFQKQKRTTISMPSKPIKAQRKGGRPRAPRPGSPPNNSALPAGGRPRAEPDRWRQATGGGGLTG